MVRKSWQWPTDFSLHADNTTAEIKNSVAGRTLAALVSAGYFRCAGHQHLRVGHSHEDVGPQRQRNTTDVNDWHLFLFKLSFNGYEFV